MKFLEEIVRKLKRKIVQMDQEILAGQKDIESMHEYYWENYTEMDQYGTRTTITSRHCSSVSMPIRILCASGHVIRRCSIRRFSEE
mgnify:FL=1